MKSREIADLERGMALLGDLSDGLHRVVDVKVWKRRKISLV